MVYQGQIEAWLGELHWRCVFGQHHLESNDHDDILTEIIICVPVFILPTVAAL